jgi:hypothetical protein
MISAANISKDIFRFTTCDSACLSYRIALVPTLDPTLRACKGNRRLPPDPSIINFDLLAPRLQPRSIGMEHEAVMSEVTDLDSTVVLSGKKGTPFPNVSCLPFLQSRRLCDCHG